MTRYFFILKFVLLCLIINNNNNIHAQTPSIVINGIHASASNIANYPYWLNAGSTLEKGNKVIAIPVIQFNINYNQTGKSLAFDSILLITNLQTVPVNKAWKIESVILDTNVTSLTGNIADNWGSQVVITDQTLQGNGTILNPLTISQQGALLGQVLKWNGTQWVPQIDTVYTDVTIKGNGTNTNPIGLAQQGAYNGQVLQWNGTSWTPGKDTVHTDATLKGIGTASNPLGLAQQGASPGQVLTWNGSAWVPQNIGGNQTLDFNLTSNKTSVICAPGYNTNSIPIIISATYISGAGNPVNLSISGLPSGITFNLSPSGGFPSFNSNLTFNVSSSVAIGVYPFVIQANGGISTKSINDTLFVTPLKKVFATPVHNYNGNLGGISGADNICQNAANNASLPGNFVAWLSTSSVNAKDRIGNAVYIRTDNALIAYGKADLLDGSIMNNINKDASGNDVGDWPVWTGTSVNGTVITNKHCNNWTSSSSSYDGWIGNRGSTSSTWTDYMGASGWSGCNTSFGALYCFEN
ncbi:MAG TPA: DUF1554 domain-containing protein [Bacteroidales bacterium]|nr:DUF1554 domain-containing protein [Bacteroidales bacterium]